MAYPLPIPTHEAVIPGFNLLGKTAFVTGGDRKSVV